MIEISYRLPSNASRSSFSSLDLREVFQYFSWVVPLLSVISLWRASSVVRHLRSRFAPLQSCMANRLAELGASQVSCPALGGVIAITSNSLMSCLYKNSSILSSPPLGSSGEPVSVSFGYTVVSEVSFWYQLGSLH